MAQGKAVGSITIKRLTNGDSLSGRITSNKTLIQVVSEDGRGAAPDWTQLANQPTLTPLVRSNRGSTITIANFTWLLDNAEIAVYNGVDATYPGGEANFTVDTATGALTIKKNIITPGQVFEHVITCKLSLSVGGNTPTAFTVDTSVRPVIATSNGYTVYFSIDGETGTTLSGSNESVTVVPHLLQGGKTVTIDGANYKVKWYKVIGGVDNDLEITTAVSDQNKDKYQRIGNNLKVLRDGVDGSAVFVCKAFAVESGAEKEVDGESVVIDDTSDVYSIIISGKDYVDPKGTTLDEKTAKVTAAVFNASNPDSSVSVPQSGWTVDVKSNITLNDIPSEQYSISYSDGKCIFSMNVDNMYETSSSGAKTDICPVVTFEAKI